MRLEQCKTIELPGVEDQRGNLAFAVGEVDIPFPIAQSIWVCDMPAGAARGGHAHLFLEEVICCFHGRLEIELDDGEHRRTVVLDDPRRGLHLAPLVWFEIRSLVAGSGYFVLASTAYDEADYIRDYDEFIATSRATASPG
jgi:hypothetical protein